MKWIAPTMVFFAVLLQYTSPAGRPLFINRDQIIAIGEPAGCSEGTGSRILTGSGYLCVKETPEKAVTIFATPQ
jgi:hypothetical protein